MPKEEYLAICASRYDELETLRGKDKFYDYEVDLEHILNDLGRQYLESALKSLLRKNGRKKNSKQNRISSHNQGCCWRRRKRYESCLE